MYRKIIASVFALLFLLAGANVKAQDNLIPLDPKVEYGILDNGMRYYILQNRKPEKKAEIRLAVNAGSLMETDAQQGLAHFCEHMAFNGSANFEKNELVSYLQSVGVKFGAHLNAYTSFDETVYMISIPTDVDTIYQKGFQIMEDWAHLVSYEGEEIDKERGVVMEEYRLGEGASKRMMAKYLPVLMAGSRYAERLPIGKRDVLENFEYEQARSFYRDWYRPDLMAIFVVGDIDVEETKKMIIDHFSEITGPENKRERITYDVPDFIESRAAVATDVEAPYTMVQLNYNQKGVNKVIETEADLRERVLHWLFSIMLNARLAEIANKPDAPYSFAYSYYGSSWARTKNAYQFFGIASEGKSLVALKTMVNESERLKKYGFTQAELDRGIKDLLSETKSEYADRDKTESQNLIWPLMSHFLKKAPAPSIEWRYNYLNKIHEGISLQEVNALANELITDNNKVAVITGPEKEGVVLPTEEEVIAVIDGKFEMDLKPYDEKALPDQIMASAPKGSSIKEIKKLEKVGAEQWTLKNGVTVICKKTELKNDEVLMSAFSYGGTSLYDDETYQKTRFGLGMISNCGIGDYSEDDLSKIYSGKIVSLYPYISETSEGMRGSCVPEDMEHMFQMIHQHFTAQRKDNDAFMAYVNSQRGFYDNMLSNPSSYYSVESTKWLYNNHPRSSTIPTEKDWNNTDYNQIYKIYKERFKYGSDFTFVFVGNFDVDVLKDHCTRYLGDLPSSKNKEVAKDVGMRARSAPDKLVVNKGLDQKSSVRISFIKEVKYDKKEAYLLESLGELLTIKLIEQLREEMSGVYGTSAYGYVSRDVYTRLIFAIGFPCGPENVDTLTDAAIGELRKIIESGPDDKDVEKVRQAQIREVEQNVQKNRFWLNHLRNTAYYNDDFSSPDDKLKAIDDLSAEDLQSIAKKYLSGDYLVTVLMPENANEK